MMMMLGEMAVVKGRRYKCGSIVWMQQTPVVVEAVADRHSISCPRSWGCADVLKRNRRMQREVCKWCS